MVVGETRPDAEAGPVMRTIASVAKRSCDSAGARSSLVAIRVVRASAGRERKRP
jgi:hypothetical protein